MVFPKLCCLHQCMLYEMSLLIYKWFWVLISIIKHIQTYKPRTCVHNVKFVCLDARNSSTEGDHHRTQKIDTYVRSVSSVLRLCSFLIDYMAYKALQYLCTVQTVDRNTLTDFRFAVLYRSIVQRMTTVVYDNTTGSSPEREIYAIVHRYRKR